MLTAKIAAGAVHLRVAQLSKASVSAKEFLDRDKSIPEDDAGAPAGAPGTAGGAAAGGTT